MEDPPPGIREQMDALYRKLGREIPWNRETPPEILLDLLDSGRIPAGRAVDLGCGAGTTAVWLAQRGFEVTGLDISAEAIRLAGELAARRGVTCRFRVADLTGEALHPGPGFDFAFEWEVLHHIFPADRPRYVRNVHRLLRPGGMYVSVCFSETDPTFGGRGKVRKTSIGTILYFSSEAELQALFTPLFRIEQLDTVEVAGRTGPHRAIMVRMIRPREGEPVEDRERRE